MRQSRSRRERGRIEGRGVRGGRGRTSVEGGTVGSVGRGSGRARGSLQRERGVEVYREEGELGQEVVADIAEVHRYTHRSLHLVRHRTFHMIDGCRYYICNYRLVISVIQSQCRPILRTCWTNSHHARQTVPHVRPIPSVHWDPMGCTMGTTTDPHCPTCPSHPICTMWYTEIPWDVPWVPPLTHTVLHVCHSSYVLRTPLIHELELLHICSVPIECV